jgi:hypothetical protein
VPGNENRPACSSNGVVAISNLPPRDIEIAGHHLNTKALSNQAITI